MEFIQIIKDCTWGTNVINIKINEIKSIEFHIGPSYIEIFYQDKNLCGHVEHNFDITPLMWNIRHNQFFSFNLYEEMQFEDENLETT